MKEYDATKYRATIRNKRGQVIYTSPECADAREAAIVAFIANPKAEIVMMCRGYGFSIQWFQRYDLRDAIRDRMEAENKTIA
jgi:hypothetical protein